MMSKFALEKKINKELTLFFVMIYLEDDIKTFFVMGYDADTSIHNLFHDKDLDCETTDYDMLGELPVKNVLESIDFQIPSKIVRQKPPTQEMNIDSFKSSLILTADKFVKRKKDKEEILKIIKKIKPIDK